MGQGAPVGEGHTRLLELLLENYDSVVATDSARAVAVIGAQGSGKTRLLWSFYESLARRQPEPAYWPPTIIADGVDHHAYRKVVAPHARVTWAPGALPSYFWWGIGCERRAAGRQTHAVVLEAEQVAAHRDGLTLAWQRRHAPVTSARLWRSAARHLRRATIDEVAAAGLATAVGQAVPFVGLAVDVARRGASAFAANRERSRRLHEEIGLDPGGQDAARAMSARLAAELTEFARGGVPVVVVVDDFHLVDPVTEELVTKLAQVDAPILVVACAWPSPESALPGALGRGTDRVALYELPPLSPQETGVLVRRHAPRTSADLVQALSARLRTPLIVEEAFRLDGVRRHMVEGALLIDENELARVPIELTDLYAQRWSELGDDARRVLVAAAAATPAQQTVELRDIETSIDLVLRVAGDLGVADPRAALGQCDLLYSSGDAVLFSDPIAYESVVQRGAMTLPRAIETCRATISTLIHEQVRSSVDGIAATVVTAMHALITEQDEPSSIESYEVLWLTRVYGARWLGDHGYFELAERLLQTFVRDTARIQSILGPDIFETVLSTAAGEAQGLRLRADVGGRTDVALRMLETELAGESDPETGQLLDRARYLRGLGRWEDALQATDAVLQDSARLREMDPIDVLALELDAALIDDERLKPLWSRAQDILERDNWLRILIERHAISAGVGIDRDTGLARLSALAEDAAKGGDAIGYVGLRRTQASLSEPLESVGIIDDLLSGWAVPGLGEKVRTCLEADRARYLVDAGSTDALASVESVITAHLVDLDPLARAAIRQAYADALVQNGRLDDAATEATLAVDELRSTIGRLRTGRMTTAVRRLAGIQRHRGQLPDALDVWDEHIEWLASYSVVDHDTLFGARLSKASERLIGGGSSEDSIDDLVGLQHDLDRAGYPADHPIAIEVRERLADALGRLGDDRAAVEGLAAALRAYDDVPSEKSNGREALVRHRLAYWQRRAAGENLPDYWVRPQVVVELDGDS